MKHDGYSSFVQTINGLIMDNNTQQKITNMKVIFNAFINQSN